MPRAKFRTKKRGASGEDAGGDPPTYYLKMKTVARDASGWSRVGAAWVSRGGNLSIKLNRGIILDWHDFGGDPPEFSLILVPAD
jgi:hypothetical protein